MFQPHVIEVNGAFIGAAVPTVGGFRFRAVHPQVDELDGFFWTSLDDLRHATGYLFRTGRLRSGNTDAPVPSDATAAQAPWTRR